MDSSLFQELGSKVKISFSKFIQLAFGGTFFSLFLLTLLDFIHPEFCDKISNIYFWECFQSLWIHVLFLVLFPFFYFIFAIFYSQKYLLYLTVELISNKAKYESVQWVLKHIPNSLHSTLQKISKKLKNNNLNTQNLIEYLINIPYQKIYETFMPSLIIFYILVFIEILTFVYLWVKL